MSKNSGRAKENLIRIMCFTLGVLLILSAVLIKERMMPNDTPEIKEAEEESEKDTKAHEEAGEEETGVKIDVEKYKIEAENLYQELISSAEEVSSEVAEPEPDGTYLIDGKPSKLNWNTSYPAISEENTLEWHAARETSYDTTMRTNEFDKKVIENSNIDFSDVKISILGDSITAATNLDEEEQALYNYPKLLGDILGCEVVNLGIGGSVVSRCASNHPMVERWNEMPDDSDIIIIFGGTNDCLFENKWQFGHVEYDLRMNKETFCGDLDEMCSGIKWKFVENTPDRYVKFIYINPMSTILNDGVYATDPGNMVEQRTFAEAINEIVPPYGFDVIDLYNQNFLNSHDPNINQNYVTDGVHPNPDGYQILAEHIASQIIQRINQ